MEIPKAIIMERVRTESGPEKANEADKEFPEKVDPEEHTDLLAKYNIDPERVREDFRGQSPAIG